MFVLVNIETKFEKSNCSGMSENRPKICVFERNELLSVHRIGTRQLALLSPRTA
jgi:hypothetical protein